MAYGLDGTSVERISEVEDAYCFHQGLHFDGTTSSFATGMSLLISAQTLRLNGVLVLTNKTASGEGAGQQSQ